MATSYEVAAAGMRALGYSLTPMFITIGGTCVVRIFWVKVHVPASFGELMGVYPVTWVITGITMLLAWRIVSGRMRAKKEAS